MESYAMDSRQAILDIYAVNEKGIIDSPGKFEGEYLYTPYFYDLMLNGESLTDSYEDNPQPGECLDVFELDSKDFQEFPELVTNGYSIGERILFTETETGFYTECRRVILNERRKLEVQKITF